MRKNMMKKAVAFGLSVAVAGSLAACGGSKTADTKAADTQAADAKTGENKGDAPAAILTREGAGPFMQVLRGADKLAGAVRSALTLGTFAGLLGMLIVFYLLYQNAADALPVMNILLYQLIWYIPVFIITQQTR